MNTSDIVKMGAIAGAIVAIGAAVVLAKDVVGVPPFASKSEVEEVNERIDIVGELAANIKLANLLTRLEIAVSKGDKKTKADLCWEIQQLTKEVHPLCR